jgi:predicted transcriptional regulator
MQTEILKTYSNEQITAEKRSFEEKYGSIENLHQKFAVGKCQNPEFVDDYMVWKAISEEEARFTERVVLKNLDIYQMMSPKRMEILDYLSSHSTESIKTLAIELKRDYKNVYDDIMALKKFGLIELLVEGKNKRPTTRIERIVVQPDRKNP